MDNTFSEVEKIFSQEYYEKNNTSNQINGNLCCDDDDENNMRTMASNIKRVVEFNILSDRDIYIVLIFIYYSLRFNEQTTDWLKTNFLSTKLTNKELGNKLFIDITIGDIILDGQNLSSAIRSYILGIVRHGGKNLLKIKKIRKIRRTQKRKKRKNKSRKTC
jgi:hypothetical protein